LKFIENLENIALKILRAAITFLYNICCRAYYSC
jgi:hypothetical protein